MYPKFKEIALDTATWTVAFLGAIEERETKSKKPFCTFHLLDGDIAITANLWNTEKKDIYKVQEKSVRSSESLMNFGGNPVWTYSFLPSDDFSFPSIRAIPSPVRTMTLNIGE